MKKPKLGRRGFLRGAAGTVIGLPLLDYMLNSSGTAYADGTEFPCRYVLFFSPTALVTNSSRVEDAIPVDHGAGYTTTKVLQPLVDRGIKDDVSVVTGLFCAPVNAPGAYNSDYHGYAYKAVLNGMRSGFEGGYAPQGPSPDEVLAQAAPADLRFRKLYYQVDPNPGTHYISFEGSPGSYRAVEPETSPANAYRTLFQDFVPPDSGPDPVAALDQRLRVSSLSFASEQIGQMTRRLGVADRRTLDAHLTHIRELERRLALTTEVPMGNSCADPSLPSNDPANMGAFPSHDARMDLFTDLTRMAFACDMTRTITISGTGQFTGSGMRHPLWASDGGLHGEVQHSDGSQSVLDDANQWFVDCYARVLEKLKATPDGDGTLLDHSAGVFVMEGGKGVRNDPQRVGDGGVGSNHCCDHMMVLMGGRAGGLRPAGRVGLEGQDRHPAEALNSAIRAMGSDARLGEIGGTVDELFA